MFITQINKKVVMFPILLFSWHRNMKETTAVNKFVKEFDIILCNYHSFVKIFSGKTVDF
jgi:hypothetical protein